MEIIESANKKFAKVEKENPPKPQEELKVTPKRKTLKNPLFATPKKESNREASPKRASKKEENTPKSTTPEKDKCTPKTKASNKEENTPKRKLSEEAEGTPKKKALKGAEATLTYTEEVNFYDQCCVSGSWIIWAPGSGSQIKSSILEIKSDRKREIT